MSRTHKERRKAAREDLLERGKERLRLAQLVLTHWFDGHGIAETARRVGKSQQVVWRVRVWLGVQSRRVEPGSRAVGRIDSRRGLEGVSP